VFAKFAILQQNIIAMMEQDSRTTMALIVHHVILTMLDFPALPADLIVWVVINRQWDRAAP
jgi:glucan phosphoethanolaminetransferase (alkaline phosphatase superfamily)